MEITQVEAFALRFQTGKLSEQQEDNYYLPAEGWRCIYARHHETMVVRITDIGWHRRVWRRTKPGLTAHIEDNRRRFVSSDTDGQRPV